MRRDTEIRHFPWCDEKTEHHRGDGGWRHDRLLGTFRPLQNDLALDELASRSPFELRIACHDKDSGARAVLSIEGWCETAEFDLAGIRRARDLFAHAADILAGACGSFR
ncbi:hypothetical protein HFP15_37375 [Amycolatopsis sp. K13G38]|uniref:Uncharacterized protein n=1 Tax=Amycolatopsis acididurans TaxID=2724524 RepID=A0ABX1JGM4_9PSEU|nr:hypothetical protein [Amycolatopsis acididurans]NKQ58534.1 hypothetical protein [Amycolatopsis acididurans]